ncbi:carbamoyltransferase N-terminal domain-containing protein [Ectothiorhodospira sp. BSL-9]|uniref:carbamoyltransferase N-terminal domain-containing protein n=1 Tax=Ectothiorhodospira sp. BSL-9 TaxID=1442136 RepID=UPI0009ED6B46|nr:carbamoyltransferase N-terminal domain-containing protein [Ectothiorhodospira sp. BSL-9]
MSSICLGINPAFDASAVLLIDGEPVASIAEERITKKKHHSYSVFNCIAKVLNDYAVKYEELDAVVVCRHGLEECLKNEESKIALQKLKEQSKQYCVCESHHLLHAYSVYYSSGFRQSSILVMDGLGTHIKYLSDLGACPIENESIFSGKYLGTAHESMTIYNAVGHRVHPVLRRLSTHNTGQFSKEDISIGRLYSYVSKKIFGSRFDAGKTMGLAPYGKDKDWKRAIAISRNNVCVKSSFLQEVDSTSKSDVMHYADLASVTQIAVEEAVLFRAKQARMLTGQNYLCVSGGVFLNCVANNRLVCDSGFKNIFCISAAGDDGIALGAAIYAHVEVLQQEYEPKTFSPYLGPRTDTGDSANYPEGMIYEDRGELISYVAKKLAQGHVIAWHWGRSEYGPRALGNRSILASPARVGVKDEVDPKIRTRG